MAATDLQALYPALADLPGLAVQLDSLPRLELTAGQQVFAEGQSCPGFPLLLEGRIRVFKQADNGREIELYRIQAGESCIVTASCLINQRHYEARAVTESPTRIVMLSRSDFHQALTHDAFRDYVLGLFADRMTDLMERVEEIAFHRLDARLAGRLLGHGSPLHVTHAQLANELGSVREIISRLLKQFEIRGLIRLGREHIEILDAAGLRLLADTRK